MGRLTIRHGRQFVHSNLYFQSHLSHVCFRSESNLKLPVNVASICLTAGLPIFAGFKIPYERISYTLQYSVPVANMSSTPSLMSLPHEIVLRIVMEVVNTDLAIFQGDGVIPPLASVRLAQCNTFLFEEVRKAYQGRAAAFGNMRLGEYLSVEELARWEFEDQWRYSKASRQFVWK